MGASGDVGWLGYRELSCGLVVVGSFIGYWELSCGLVVVGSLIGYRCFGAKNLSLM